MIVVADSGPLHYLVLLEHIELLQRFYGHVLVPEPVAGELSVTSAPAVVRDWMRNPPTWVDVRPVPSDAVSMITDDLDLGERAAIALAETMHADLLLIDEAAGRAEAKRRHLRVTGTLGVLRAGAEQGLSAHSFEQVVRQAKARFVVGLSATVARKDGHHPIIFMQCGPVRHQVSARAQAASRPFEHFVLVQPTSFRPTRDPGPDKRVEFQTLYQELVDDEARTRRICEDVLDAVRNGRSPLILTERNEHLDRFEHELASRVAHVIVLRAGMGKKQRQAVNERLAAIPRDEGRIIVATGKYVGEGFDDPRLDTLFLTLPVSWRGTVAQYAGRLHRLYDGKREVRIYDYADLNVPMLARMFDRRCRGYEAIGYTILLPASAVPGWPADVVLPSDPVWKRDYSGSVRRLIRDGVDTPLASLFVHAARTMPEDAEGAARARSASEAFLYRRLDTLAETNGRFRLNAALPIPFDGFGTLEVDLLCADARVAIELDGGQHLADPIAYRRDRRKDHMLQENGYFVLRFLAEDVGKELDAVLDAILRVLARRRHSASGAEPLRFIRRGR